VNLHFILIFSRENKKKFQIAVSKYAKKKFSYQAINLLNWGVLGGRTGILFYENDFSFMVIISK